MPRLISEGFISLCPHNFDCASWQIPMEHSRARPGVYLCWTRSWFTASQWELSEMLIYHMDFYRDRMSALKQIRKKIIFLKLFLTSSGHHRPRFGPSAHVKKKHTQSDQPSPSGLSTLLDLMTHSLDSKWWELVSKASLRLVVLLFSICLRNVWNHSFATFCGLNVQNSCVFVCFSFLF